MHNYNICAMFCIDDLILGSLGRLIMASAKKTRSKAKKRSVAGKAKRKSPLKKAAVRKSSHKKTSHKRKAGKKTVVKKSRSKKSGVKKASRKKASRKKASHHRSRAKAVKARLQLA